MPVFPDDIPADALFIQRSDNSQLLGTYVDYGFELEDKFWPTAEHYYQSKKFSDQDKQEVVRNADSPKKARALGRKRDRSFRKDWKDIRQIVMTRAIYTRSKSFQELSEALLATGERQIIENSNYDYYWGCGRDRRGNNAYGKVLMNVRKKLAEELRFC